MNNPIISQSKKIKHFLELKDISKQNLRDIITLASQIKEMQEDRK